MTKNIHSEKEGSILVLTLVLLTASCLVIGALAVLTATNSRNLRLTIAREQAFYLADAGLRLAINQMENDQSGVISRQSSHAFFSDTSVFGGGESVGSSSIQSSGADSMEWGFGTSIQNISGRTNRLVCSGRFDDAGEDAEVTCVDVSEDIYLNFIYRLVVYSGALGGNFQVGGTGSSADFVNGDIYVRGNVQVLGDARLRYGEKDDNNNGVLETGEDWSEAYAVQHLGPMTQSEFDAYCATVSPYSYLCYKNGEYDPGEAFVDSIGNGVYDENEEFTDLNGDGVYTPGDTVVDTGNGVWDEGEPWVDDEDRYGRDNGRYDPAGGYYDSYGNWKTSYTTGWWWWTKTYSCAGWPPEAFEDQSDTTYTEPEPFVDRNGVYDEGEEFWDDRNGTYDWGTMASGLITGMEYVDESLGIRNALGGNAYVEPPNLSKMYYSWPKTGATPPYASEGWGYDYAVTASDYSSNGHVINDEDVPEHIFVRNVPDNDPSLGNDKYRVTYGGVSVRSRGYELVYDDNGDRVDDYFLEDPTDSYYHSYDTGNSIDGTSQTAPSYIDVQPEHNEKVYYVDGNVYIHGTPTWSYRFKDPGTKITIVANGNITISDEFYYNAEYDENLDRDDMDSTVVNNASDVLCLIALKNPSCTNNSGNIYIGDPAKGTGGSIHAMMYAENDFIDNNIGGSGQSFISIYGNMAAGGELAIHRDAWDWTRLDVTLDRRLSQGTIVAQGLPPAPAGSFFIGNDGVPDWKILPGTWASSSIMDE